MLMPGRKYPAAGGLYRYGFNGKEKNNEISGGVNNYDFGARIYDPRIGRWYSTDPLQIKYPNITPYAAFNDNPIYFKDPDGKDGIASITKSDGTKKKPHIVTVTANYYYSQATEAQLTAMKSVQSELAGAKSVEKDGQFYKVVINVNFIKSEDPVASAKKDVGVNGGKYGNVLKIQDGDGGEFGDANNERIRVFENKVLSISSQFTEDNQAASYQAVFRNVLKEEVLHNLGGLHQDDGALPPETSYTTGSSSLTEKEKPAQENSYSKDNAAAIFNRIDKPLGTDAKEDPKNKKGEVIEPRLRDTKGTVGQVKIDTQKTP
jgi:RHS repeat-associated protein